MKADFLEVESFLSTTHCKNLQALCDEHVSGMEEPGYWDRARVRDLKLSCMLTKMLTEHANISRFLGETDFWCNHLLFFTRYKEGTGIGVHVDGEVETPLERSIGTFIIYLNDCFNGGETKFVEEGRVTDTVHPSTGKLLILNQETPHLGAAVQKGIKYILRGDIMVHKAQHV